jgi:checkpoint serine/threonine-protein kinase
VLFIFCVFQALGAFFNEHDQEANHANPIHAQQQIVNPKTGRRERIMVNLEAIYPDGHEKGREYSLEELRARGQGSLDIDWNEIRKRRHEKVEKQSPIPEIDLLSLGEDREVPKFTNASPRPAKMPIFEDFESAVKPVKIPIYDDGDTAAAQNQAIANKKKGRREDRANRTQKIQVMEVRAEPQTGRHCDST